MFLKIFLTLYHSLLHSIFIDYCRTKKIKIIIWNYDERYMIWYYKLGNLFSESQNYEYNGLSYLGHRKYYITHDIQGYIYKEKNYTLN